jgi:hypothetical protein
MEVSAAWDWPGRAPSRMKVLMCQNISRLCMCQDVHSRRCQECAFHQIGETSAVPTVSCHKRNLHRYYNLLTLTDPPCGTGSALAQVAQSCCEPLVQHFMFPRAAAPSGGSSLAVSMPLFCQAQMNQLGLSSHGRQECISCY